MESRDEQENIEGIETADALSVRIEKLDLPFRARTVLYLLGVETVGDLAKRSELELMCCKNFGQGSLDAVKSILTNFGLNFSGVFTTDDFVRVGRNYDIGRRELRARLKTLRREEHENKPTGLAKKVAELVDDGIIDANEIALRLKTTPYNIHRMVKTYGLNVQENADGFYARTQIRPEADKLIRLGATLSEICEAVGWKHKQSAAEYLEKSGQHDAWKRAQAEGNDAVNRDNAIRKELIAGIASSVLRKKYGAASWAEQRALDYVAGRKFTIAVGDKQSYNFDALVELFRRYDIARENGEKLTLGELGNGLISTPSIGRILRKTGLSNLNYNLERHLTPNKKKAALRRATNVDMSPADIAYFVGVPYYVAQQNMQLYGRERHFGKPIVQLGRESGKILTYRLASQIYEAEDLGFTDGETQELLDAESRVVQYALEHREEIAGKIVKDLRKIFLRKIEKPYLE